MSNEVRFLAVDEVIALQETQLEKYKGGVPGIRNSGQLAAAVELPAMTLQFTGRLNAAAAGYLTYLVRDHVFEQGNKRIGLASALVFLAVNGYKVNATNVELTDLVMTMASTGDTREAVEAFFDAHIEAVEPMSLDAASEWMHGAYAPTFIELAK